MGLSLGDAEDGEPGEAGTDGYILCDCERVATVGVFGSELKLRRFDRERAARLTTRCRRVPRRERSSAMVG